MAGVAGVMESRPKEKNAHRNICLINKIDRHVLRALDS
jgi:hypothetical protein